MLERQRFLIKEHVAFAKLVDHYDIYDLDNQEHLGSAHEEPGAFVQWLRLIVSKQLMPTRVVIRERDDDSLLFTLRRPMYFLQPRVEVLDAEDQLVGTLRTKMLSWKAGFWVYDHQNRPLAEVRGDWLAWKFTFHAADGTELGQVSKQWTGFGKEFFTSADNYAVLIADELQSNPVAKMLLLAAALAVDMVFKEGN